MGNLRFATTKIRVNLLPSERVYRFIVAFKETHDGNSPTIREIGEDCGITSTSMVLFYLDKLEDKGLIRRPEPEIGNRFASRIEVIGGNWSFQGGGHVA